MMKAQPQAKDFQDSSHPPAKGHFRPRPFISPLPEQQASIREAPDRIAQFGHNFKEVSLSTIIQPKLKVGLPNDRYEQEADRVAEQVMRMPCPLRKDELEDAETVRPRSIPNRINPMEQKKAGLDERDIIHQKPAADQAASVSPRLESQILSMGAGRPLQKSERDFFEPRFGHDFGRVRVHTDEMAAGMADAMNAQAFTLGHDVAFGAGQYKPETANGRRLLAHELTHVLQQTSSQDRCSRDRPSAIQLEREDEVKPEDRTILPSGRAVAAVAHAYTMMNQNIWFDSWGNDLRDNDNDGRIDNSGEHAPDGAHYRGSYRSSICGMSRFLTIDQCPSFFRQSIDVQYKVCIDVPKESYAAAGITMPGTRWIPSLVRWFERNRNFQTWRGAALPRILLPGDFICVMSGGHQHSGLIATFGISTPWMVEVIHLPGPTSRRALAGQLTYHPSATNDIYRTPWPFNIDFIARPRI